MIARLRAALGIGSKVELRLDSPVAGEVVLYADGMPILRHIGSPVGCSLYAGGRHGTVVTAPERP